MDIKEDHVRFIRTAITQIANDAERDAEFERNAKRMPGAISLESVARALRDVLKAVPEVK